MQIARPDRALVDFLSSSGLAEGSEEPIWEPLAGGVSSDIWKVTLRARRICVKRALPKLKVAADWHAPVSRNNQEWAWLLFAHQHCPANVPAPLAHDEKAGILAMEFLEPDAHPVWKLQLMNATVSPETSERVARLIAELHRRSAHSQAVAQDFDSMSTFYALRLEPYLVATSAGHPDVAAKIMKLVEEQRDARIALVHGDVSPKNILVGPNGPVLLDAECACFGDPSFDLAFCLNHLLLKCLVLEKRRDALDHSARRLVRAYLDRVDWEEPADIERRAARLLPALTLARIDGKSPVEYVTREQDKNFVRSFALEAIKRDDASLTELVTHWRDALSRSGL